MVEKSPAQKLLGDTAPALADYTDNVIFGDVWKRSDINPRDRSLVTISSLIALQRLEQLEIHIRLGLANGLSKDEVVATITHLAFYSGWPTAVSSVGVARKVFAETA